MRKRVDIRRAAEKILQQFSEHNNDYLFVQVNNFKWGIIKSNKRKTKNIIQVYYLGNIRRNTRSSIVTE